MPIQKAKGIDIDKLFQNKNINNTATRKQRIIVQDYSCINNHLYGDERLIHIATVTKLIHQMSTKKH